MLVKLNHVQFQIDAFNALDGNRLYLAGTKEPLSLSVEDLSLLRDFFGKVVPHIDAALALSELNNRTPASQTTIDTTAEVVQPVEQPAVNDQEIIDEIRRKIQAQTGKDVSDEQIIAALEKMIPANSVGQEQKPKVVPITHGRRPIN